MSPSEKEHLSEEIRMRVGTVLSTLYAVSVMSYVGIDLWLITQND